MKVVVYGTMMKMGSVDSRLGCVVNGFRRHGIIPDLRKHGDFVKCDLAVCWGTRRPHQMRTGTRSLIIERGYIGDRFHWTSVGYDGLNGRADFCNREVGGHRWDTLFSKYMRPWKNTTKGKYILLAGQVPNDMSLRGLDTGKMYEQVRLAAENAGIPLLFRPHPKAPHVRIAGIPNVQSGNLTDDLGRALWVVTINSNTSVDAVLQGIPTVTMDKGSMAYDVTGHDPGKMPPSPDRTKWAHSLAFTQWSPDEISMGKAWDHLKSGMGIS